MLIATAFVLPSMPADFSARLHARLGLIEVPATGGLPFPAVTGALSSVGGLTFLAGWAYAARRARQGVRWAAVCVGLICGVAVVSAVLLPVVLLLGICYPWWLSVLYDVGLAVDVAVLVCLGNRRSRAWYAARTPRPPSPPWTTPPPAPVWSGHPWGAPGVSPPQAPPPPPPGTSAWYTGHPGRGPS